LSCSAIERAPSATNQLSGSQVAVVLPDVLTNQPVCPKFA